MIRNKRPFVMIADVDAYEHRPSGLGAGRDVFPGGYMMITDAYRMGWWSYMKYRIRTLVRRLMGTDYGGIDYSAYRQRVGAIVSAKACYSMFKGTTGKPYELQLLIPDTSDKPVDTKDYAV